MSQYFPEQYERSGGNVKIELDLSNYETKSDLTLSSKTDLASLKTKVDNLDVDKLVTVYADLSKLSNVVNNDVVNKTVYDKLVTKVNAVDTKILSSS